MADKKSTAKKATVKMPDLIPRKDPFGGGGFMHPNRPALSIPPPGFVKQPENKEGR